MARRSGLGKGLGALIPDADDEVSEAGVLRDLDIESVRPNRYQPRGHFDEDALSSLTASIAELGVLQPVLVRPVGDHFELIAGERRWRSAKAAGLNMIPALVREVDDNSSLEQALVENLQRDDLSAMEEAAAFRQLADDFDLSFDEIGRRMGKGRSTVANSVRLLQLPMPIQKMVNERRLSAGHARSLLSIEDDDVQIQLAERAISEDLSVRQTEEAVRFANELSTGKRRDAKNKVVERPAGIFDHEESLSEHLATKVEIRLGAKERGTIVISYAGFEDLDRLTGLICGDLETSV